MNLLLQRPGTPRDDDLLKVFNDRFSISTNFEPASVQQPERPTFVEVETLILSDWFTDPGLGHIVTEDNVDQRVNRPGNTGGS